jgi:hypothetical protein
MRVTHTIAAALTGILLIQSVGLAQALPEPVARPVSREQAIQILLSNLDVGADVRIDLADGQRVEGRLIEKSSGELVVVAGRQRRIVAAADVVSIRVPMRSRMTGGKAFRLGAEISSGVIVGGFIALAVGRR